MTLSGWFRDYLFIPLGGSRGSTEQTVRNLAIVFFVTGLWHGAALSFVVWGCYHGALVIIERLTGTGTTDPHVRLWPLRRAVTFLLVLIGWVIFRANGLRHGLNYLQRMFVPQGGGIDSTVAELMDSRAWLALVLAVGTLALPASLAVGRQLMVSHSKVVGGVRLAVMFGVFPLALLVVSVGDFSPFLYFQF
jgi:alginate O-acetyltransferase complex protein AlgI